MTVAPGENIFNEYDEIIRYEWLEANETSIITENLGPLDKMLKYRDKTFT